MFEDYERLLLKVKARNEDMETIKICNELEDGENIDEDDDQNMGEIGKIQLATSSSWNDRARQLGIPGDPWLWKRDDVVSWLDWTVSMFCHRSNTFDSFIKDFKVCLSGYYFKSLCPSVCKCKCVSLFLICKFDYHFSATLTYLNIKCTQSMAQVLCMLIAKSL